MTDSSHVYAGTRRDRERIARRQAILSAAVEVFAEAGYTGATIEEIATRAEFGKGTVYNYFSDKRELLLAVIDTSAGELFEHMSQQLERAVEEQPDARDFFHSFIDSTLRYFLARTKIFQLLFKETGRLLLEGDEHILSVVQNHERRVIELLSGHVHRFIEAGKLRSFPAPAVAHLLMGNIHGYLHYVLMTPPDQCPQPTLPTERASEFIATALFDGLLQAPHSEPL